MSVNTAAMVARERFADALKTARLAARTPTGARIKQIDISAALGRDTVDRYSRLERGTVWPDDEEWPVILQALNVGLETRVALDTMRREGMAIGGAWWTAYEDEFPESLIQFIAYEDAARKIATCSVNTFPSLLHEETYARALTRAATGGSTVAAERSVELRVKRRSVFEKSQSPTVEAIFSEGALHQLVGGTGVMAAQLDSLLVDASRGVSMRIVPFSSGVTPVYMFHLLEFGGADERPIAAVDNMTGMTFRKASRDVREVREFRHSINILQGAALSAEESLELIQSKRKELSSAA